MGSQEINTRKFRLKLKCNFSIGGRQYLAIGFFGDERTVFGRKIFEIIKSEYKNGRIVDEEEANVIYNVRQGLPEELQNNVLVTTATFIGGNNIVRAFSYGGRDWHICYRNLDIRWNKSHLVLLRVE